MSLSAEVLARGRQRATAARRSGFTHYHPLAPDLCAVHGRDGSLRFRIEVSPRVEVTGEPADLDRAVAALAAELRERLTALAPVMAEYRAVMETPAT